MRFTLKTLIAMILAAFMCVAFAACGNSEGSTEETVEITTVTEEQQEDSEEESISIYHQIYDEYAEKMDSAEDMDALDKVYEEGKSKMKNAMLESTEDDQDTYEDWFGKLGEKYTEKATSLT